jgi:CBS domain-containing protein
MGKVRNIIQTKGNAVFSIPSSTTVYNALELMLEKSIGALLVVDNTKFVGIFTERDYARKLILKGKSSKETLIREVMTERPITVGLDTSIEDCMKIMSDKKIRHLPVVENENLTGLISVGDVVKFIIEEQKFIIENLEQYITH